MAARAFSAYINATNTTSTTVPMFTITNPASGTTRRFTIKQLIIGSAGTPADNSAVFSLRRTTARGTSSTAITANAMDPGSSSAAVILCDTAWSVNPTITANSDLVQIPMNQRNTIIWTPPPEDEIVVADGAGNGVALVAVASNSTGTYYFWVLWEE